MSDTQEVGVYVGQDYDIKASMGYAGILNGLVRVEKVVWFPNVPREHGAAWFDADVQSIPSMNEKYYQDAVDEVYRRVTEPWVCYTYPNGEEDGDCYLPISIFTDHVTEA